VLLALAIHALDQECKYKDLGLSILGSVDTQRYRLLFLVQSTWST
jgi:hypothetical protein